MTVGNTRRAAFLDRDGTIIVDHGYLSDPSRVQLLPQAAAALQSLIDAGYALVIVSNQSGIARGLIPRDRHAAVHAATLAALAAAGIPVLAAYYCEHGPDDGCACRKPSPGMLLRAAEEHGIDLARSLMIGDKPSDVEAGRAAGCRAELLVDGDWHTLLSKLS